MPDRDHRQLRQALLNTVKRHTRAASPEELQHPPRYGRTLVDPPTATTCAASWAPNRTCRSPGLLDEIHQLGYSGNANLLVCYLNQGRVRPSGPVHRRGGRCRGS